MAKLKEAVAATRRAGKDLAVLAAGVGRDVGDRIRSTRAYQAVETAQYDPPPIRLTAWLKICGIIGVVMLVAMLFVRWDAKKKALVEFEAARKVAVSKAISEIEEKNRALLDIINRLERKATEAVAAARDADKKANERIAALTAVKSACAVEGKSDIERINAVIKEANK